MIKFLIKFFVTVFLLVVVFNFIEHDKFISNIFKLNLNDFFGLFLIIFFSLLFNFLRLKLMITKIFNLKISNLRVFSIFSFSMGLSQLPLFGGQELYKYYDISKITNHKELSAYTVIIERLSGLVINIFFLVISCTFLIKIYFVEFFFYYFFLLFLISFCFIFFFKKIIYRVSYLNYIFQYVKYNTLNIREIFFKISLYSFIIQILSLYLGYYCLSLFMEVKFIILTIIVLQLANIILALPISFAGIGLRDIVYIFLIGLIDNFSANDVASSTMLINFSVLISILTLVIINLIFFRNKP